MRARQAFARFRLWALAATLVSIGFVACAPSQPSLHDRAPASLTPTPTATPHIPDPSDYYGLTPAQDANVQWYLQHMTLDDKLGQMMLIETLYTTYSHDVDNMVHGMHAGAMIVYKQNMLIDNPSGPATLRTYLGNIQAHADMPLLITMDEEGGGVDRLGAYGFAAALPAPEQTAKTNDPKNAYAAGMQAAKSMLSFGINTNLAPLADIRGSNSSILSTRMYGSDPATVVSFASQFLLGSQQHGVIATLKHWPGAGGLTVDPHKALPVTTRTRDQLESFEFASFRALLPEHPGMIMVTHVLVEALDPKLPSTLSPAVVQAILRDEMGYQGVVMTDSLYMQGIALNYNLGQAAVLSVLAGDDLLEGAYDTGSMHSMINAIKAAMTNGQITQARIDRSVWRILALKAAYGLLPAHPAAPAATPIA
jgi:beta-N-acetylhexosaminidase